MKIDKSWTLFLDRDGVINKRVAGGYVTGWDQFVFLPGALQALSILSGMFGKMLVVSNQQGVGKGIMTEKDLEEIHGRMVSEIRKAGGRIDRIYYSPFLEEENSDLRKPNTGMAVRAKQDFPEIDFTLSVMTGDSVSDMHFGKRMNMTTVLITAVAASTGQADFVFPDLLSFARAVSPG